MSAAPEVGKTYNVASSRKGKFTMLVTGVNETFADGIITSGHAQALLPENEREMGEEVTVRIELCKFTLIEGQQK